MDISHYVQKCYAELPQLTEYTYPWDVTRIMQQFIAQCLHKLPLSEFVHSDGVAIHRTATIEEYVVIKKYSVLGEGSVVKSGAYLRDGVYIGKEVMIGANCEIKQSIIFNKSRVAHLNYVGNSMIGEDVNLEAGSVLANHFNERENKRIQVIVDGTLIDTSVSKFGSLVGDGSRIGANAVLNPGTILNRKSIVSQLAHVNQLKNTG